MDNQKANYSKSAQAFGEAVKFLPGGVNSPVRAFGGVDIGPLFIERAAGAKIYDIDGNEYIDYVGSWGPMILGHAHPKVLEAIRAVAEKGASFGAPTLAETRLAEKIIAAFDSVEKVRLVSSGTEAVMTAVRLARGFTKKDLIIKMAGCYHGHSDSLLAAAGSGLAERGTPSSAGVPDSIAALTIVIPYNDIDSAKKSFQMHKGRIAAVFVEPVAANMGVVLPLNGYLQELRSLCDDNETLLIWQNHRRRPARSRSRRSHRYYGYARSGRPGLSGRYPQRQSNRNRCRQCNTGYSNRRRLLPKTRIFNRSIGSRPSQCRQRCKDTCYNQSPRFDYELFLYRQTCAKL
jgi:4-aminobutyrate aminotransferase-like enzyme